MLPCVIFMFIWTTVVYDPIACWTWNPAGWVYKMGGLDFAGGTPVHISSGSAALAYSYILGKRNGHGTPALNFRPHNVAHVVIGTVFLWVGWFGFNAGSALSANLRAVMAAVVTNLAACVGGVTWCVVDYRLEKKWSTVGFCSGIVAGLVAITPASGFVPAWSAVIFGMVAGVGCNFATQLKFWIGIDDALDIFAVHGVGGILGNLLTGFFAADYIAHLDGSTVIAGGWLNHHWIQLAYQLCDSATGFAYSFGMTTIILLTMTFLSRWIPALSLRASSEEEDLGIDDVEIGEFAYDYVELIRDIKPLDSRDVDEIYAPNSPRNGHRDDDDDDDDMSQRSHSQATILHAPEKTMQGMGPTTTSTAVSSPQSYAMRNLSRDTEYGAYPPPPAARGQEGFGVHTAIVGQAS